MGHKAFRRAADLEPIWFTLPDQNDEDVRFDCQTELASGVIMQFAEAFDTGDSEDEQGANVIGAVRDLFDSTVVPEQRDQFWTMINDREHPIGISILIEVAQWLAGEYTDRPTGQSSSNGPSRTSTGKRSTGGVSRTAKTYSRPERVPALTSSSTI